jgi:hypothetical protein
MVARRARVRGRLSAKTPLHNGILGCPGAIAQLGERLLCKQEVAGSIPAGSINTCKWAFLT